MAIINSYGKGSYPYTFQVEPYWNGAPISYSNQVALSPRFTNMATADAFSYSVDADYAPAGCYADLTLVWPGITDWYTTLSGYGGPNNELNHPGSLSSRVNGARSFYMRPDGTNMGSSGRFSIWMCLFIGDNPHPGVGTAETYFSLLTNANGDYSGGAFYAHPGGTPTPTSPREYFSGSRKIRVSGQNYGNGGYRDWVCIANQQPANGYIANINATTLRVINIGRQTTTATANLRIAGFRIIYHVLPGADGYFGNLDM